MGFGQQIRAHLVHDAHNETLFLDLVGFDSVLVLKDLACKLSVCAPEA
jgi:hypothetical protein